MTSSLPDAQALMTPATLIIVVPISMMGVVIHDPNGMFATVMSWIPIYTPFFMLVRLPFHPPSIELWLTAVLVVLTTIFLIYRMGRLFANHVLTTERPPAFGALSSSYWAADGGAPDTTKGPPPISDGLRISA